MPRILVVDDEIDNVELMERRLIRRGYEVLKANSAKDGIRLAREGEPGLILMDLKMPEMDGYEAISLLKADPAVKAIPIIALTAFAMPEERERAFTVGANEYEPKPVDFPSLLEKIARFFAPQS